MRNFFLFIFLLLFTSISLCQTFQTIEVEFERVYVNKDITEILGGKIFYQSPDDLRLLITKPIKQWMILRGNKFDIYYPDDKKAFRIISKFPPSLPLFEAFVGAVKEDYGLIELGYSMSTYGTKGETLFTYWDPPEKTSKTLGKFTLEFIENKIAYVEAINAKGKIIAKSFYRNHLSYGANYFPLEITTVRYFDSDSTFEKVTYTNPVFDKKFSSDSTDFKIPFEVKVEEIEW